MSTAGSISDMTLVLRGMRTRGLSTIITILSVALAVALVLVLLTLRDSGKRTFERGTGDMHLLVTADASPLTGVLNSIFFASTPPRALPHTKFQAIAESAPWSYALPLAFGDSWRSAPVVGVTADFFASFRPAPDAPFALRTGRFLGVPEANGAPATNFEVVVGSAVAQRANLRVGDTLFITHGFSRSAGEIAGDLVRAGGRLPTPGGEHDHDHSGHDSGTEAHVHFDYGFRVVGILEPTATPHDRALFIPLQGAWVMHAQDRLAKQSLQPQVGPVATEQDLLESDKLVTAIYARLITREGSDVPANLQAVFDQLRRDPTITISQPTQQIGQLFTIVDGVHRLFVAMAIVVMLSSGVGILLALYNSMHERRRQVAILRVLGATKARILNLVLAESALLGIAGGALGVVLALGGALLTSGLLRSRFGLVIAPQLDARVIVIVVASAVLLACLAGLLPALAAYRVSVAKHLRPVG
jgi:putative ABC transport system permease protein